MTGRWEGKACCGDTVRAALGCFLHQPWMELEVVMQRWEGWQGNPPGQWEATTKPQDPMGRSLLWGLFWHDSRVPTAGRPQPCCHPQVVLPAMRVPLGKNKI